MYGGLRFLSSLKHSTEVVERVDPHAGTCPSCGYWNHPDANVCESGRLVYCNNCGATWRTNWRVHEST